jgi:hypothetical protein
MEVPEVKDEPETDKSPGWEERHPNPSGLSDDEKKPQPVPEGPKPPAVPLKGIQERGVPPK